MKFFRVTRKWHPPFPSSSHNDRSHPRDWTPDRLLMPIKRGAGYENQNRNDYPDRGQTIPQGPTNIVLNVNKSCVGKECPKEDAEHPPIEER
ncbi:hypothetical protein GQ457_13G026220 [Hibiscus cannabinus]